MITFHCLLNTFIVISFSKARLFQRIRLENRPRKWNIFASFLFLYEFFLLNGFYGYPKYLTSHCEKNIKVYNIIVNNFLRILSRYRIRISWTQCFFTSRMYLRMYLFQCNYVAYLAIFFETHWNVRVIDQRRKQLIFSFFWITENLEPCIGNVSIKVSETHSYNYL